MQIIRNNKFIIFYYAVLLLIMALRTSISAPNIVLRIAYLLAFFVPLVLKYNYLYLPCVICFMSVCTYNYAFGYLPYDLGSYAFLTFLFFIIIKRTNTKFIIRPIYLIVILYVFLINILYSGMPQDISYSLIVISLGAVITENHKISRFNMLNCFVVITLVLSTIYLFNYEKFLESYNMYDSMERSGWTDPNYLSCIVGMGVVSSFILLLREKQVITYIKIIWILSIILGLVSQILMASRGGLLSVSVSCGVLIFFSRIRKLYKAYIIVLLSVFLVFLYSNNYFDLLIYRIEGDTGGSGRIGIWQMKLFLFFQNGNFLEWLFGIGYENAFSLSNNSKPIGFHNDYLAFLCGYGIVGLLMLIYLIIFLPILQTSKSSRPIVVTLVLYLLLTLLTLEPLSVGRLTYWAFYYLILLYADKTITE